MLRPFLLATACLLVLSACTLIVAPQAAVPPPPKPLVYVAIGASDAVGVGAAGPAESWVADLAKKLPDGSRLVNLGISGETLHGALTDELPIAVDANPDLVTIWLAVNDLNARVTPERYEQDLDTMLGTLHQQTHARVAVANVPDLSLVPAYSGIDPALVAQGVDRWNTIIARQAARNGATLIDLHGSWRDLAAHPEYVGLDGFHPSADGYQRLADLFYRSLRAQGLV
ncbi:MAG: SGNH/GDSL hydrolase family protein [Chloroflexota bacterium]